MNDNLLEKFADLAVNVGANVQQDQVVVINASTETKTLARKITESAYKAGAKKVIVQWSDDYVSRYGYDHMNVDTLTDIPEYAINKYQYFVDQGACVISITSPIPGLNKGVDPKKMQETTKARSQALSFYREHMMGNKSQWSIVAAPNVPWANKIFPDLDDTEAVEALWDAILKASRVTEDNDPIQEWKEHNERLLHHNTILNDYQFKSLHFKNSLGTDITIDLVENHVWAGGGETSAKGVYFNPNIPTEETFTMPHKDGVNGKVVATKPLNYQGNVIEDFWLKFEHGKVIDYDAKKEKDTLTNLLELDEGSSRLGEIALISHDSPISNMDILFFNTLFDENASCHMALGRAYPMNIAGGTQMDKEELTKKGYNDSLAHSDFMFGSEDLAVTGITKDGQKVPIFEKGNFII
ncbi:MAG: aminopeptidase [Candidatus Izemoplasma sp.]|nr:aminopeptidase [Candidatus Izemoplasma sp.]